MGENWDYQPTPIAAPIKDIGIAIQKALSLIGKGEDPYTDISMDDVIGLIESIAKPAGEFTGVPTPYLIQAEKAIRSGDLRQFVFSQSALEEPEPDLQTKAKDIVNRIGQMEEPDANAPVDKVPAIQDMGSTFTALKGKFNKTLPSDITEDNGFDPVTVSFGETLISLDAYESLPNKPLYQIVDGIASDESLNYTIMQYYLDWQERSKITSLAELKEFDKTHPRFQYGNLTRSQLDLLLRYEALPTTEDKAEFLKEHPELKEDPRDLWLKDNPEENAKLAFWGQAKILSLQAYNLVLKMVKGYGVSSEALELTLPPQSISKAYFNYMDTAAQWGASSPEAKMLLIDNTALREWLKRDPITTPVPVLELQIKNRDLQEQYDALTSEKAKAEFMTGHHDYADDLLRIQSYTSTYNWDNTILDKEIVENWVEYNNIESDLERELYRYEHPDFEQWGETSRPGTEWEPLNIVSIDALKLKIKNQDLKAERDDLITDEDKDQFDLAHPDYVADEKRIEAFNKGATADEAEMYVEYAFESSEDKQDLMRLENPDLEDFLVRKKGLQPVDVKSIDALKLKIEIQPQQDEFDSLTTAKQKADYLAENTDFAQDQIRLTGYNAGVSTDYIEDYVTFDQMTTDGYIRENWLRGNQDYYKNVYIGVLNNKPLDFVAIPTNRVYQQYQVLNNIEGSVAKWEYRMTHRDLESWLVNIKGRIPASDYEVHVSKNGVRSLKRVRTTPQIRYVSPVDTEGLKDTDTTEEADTEDESTPADIALENKLADIDALIKGMQ